ncbi:MAG: polyprenyl synthetase family protein, partial [Planctomycetota bacterium]
AMIMTAGELLQLAHRGDWSLDENTYFEIVHRKTAALIGLACALGAAASRAGREIEAALRTYGERCGVAFQIQDDLLDLTGEQRTVGKSVGRDLAKGKLTLPMVHALQSVGPMLRGEMLTLIEAAGRAGSAGETDDEAVARLREIVTEAGSIEHARAAAERLVGDAKNALAIVPETPAREFLQVSSDAVVDRRF